MLVPDAFPRLLSRLAPVAVLAALAALAVAPTSLTATKSCADQIVADWYGDGRVDKIYRIPCYQEAIRSLPVDVLDYSNAREDILRALAYAKQGKPDPGPSGGSGPTGTSPDDPTGSGDPGGEETSAADDLDTSGPSSVPIPLLILGGLALLLLAAGGAGYLSRRAQARREGGPPGPA
jgi:hypothetical protein